VAESRGKRARERQVDRSPRRDGQGEHRLPPVVALVVAGILYGLLPDSLLLGPRLLIPALEAVLLVAVVCTNPGRLNRESRLSRYVSLALTAVVLLTNLTAEGLLVMHLVTADKSSGSTLLIAALQVWATNVIAFGLLYWELDRGGPVARARSRRDQLVLADFRFSQDENADTVVEVADGSSEKSDWVPTLVDYLYVSTTNSSAFSPTDTMPLSHRAKSLMAVQATAALIITLLVIARAVSALGG
jgi:hypothetical protein